MFQKYRNCVLHSSYHFSVDEKKDIEKEIIYTLIHVLGILRLHTTAHAKSVVIKQMELQQQEAVWQKEEPLQLIQVSFHTEQKLSSEDIYLQQKTVVERLSRITLISMWTAMKKQRRLAWQMPLYIWWSKDFFWRFIMNCKMRDSKVMKSCFAVFSELKTQAFIFI